MKIFDYNVKMREELRYVMRDKVTKEVTDTGVITSNTMSAWGLEMLARRVGGEGAQTYITRIDAYHSSWERKTIDLPPVVAGAELTCHHESDPFDTPDTYTKVRTAYHTWTPGDATEYFNEITGLSLTLPASSELIFYMKFTCSGVGAGGIDNILHRLGNTTNATYDAVLDEMGANDGGWTFESTTNTIETNTTLVLVNTAAFPGSATYVIIGFFFEAAHTIPFYQVSTMSIQVPAGAEFYVYGRFTFS